MKTETKIIFAAILGAAIGYAIGSYQKKKTQLNELSISELNAKLEKLVEIEDFETACIVRDIINDKTKQNVR